MYEPYIHAIRIGHPSTTLSHTLEGSASARPYCRDLERIRRADPPLVNCRCAPTAMMMAAPSRCVHSSDRSAVPRFDLALPRQSKRRKQCAAAAQHAPRIEGVAAWRRRAWGRGGGSTSRPERPRSVAPVPCAFECYTPCLNV
jgi:hypothetical protein